MSQTAKLSILILGLLLVVTCVFAGFTVYNKETLAKENRSYLEQIEEFQNREKGQIIESKKLKDKIKEVETQKAELEAQLADFEGMDLKQLKSKMDKLTAERDEWQNRVNALRTERDELLVKLQEQPGSSQEGENQKIAQLENELAVNEVKLQQALEEVERLRVQKPSDSLAVNLTGQEDDSYWAKVLREKAAMQLDLDNLRRDVSESKVKLVELRKYNSDFQLEINKLANEKVDIEREIKHGNDLADTLALQLARAQNDKKFLGDRLGKIKTDNTGLREQIKRLSSTKIALEKSIVRLQEEKKDIEKKLLQTENVIQSRIDQIWEIKDSLEKTFSPSKSSTEIELPPIIVSPDENVSILNRETEEFEPISRLKNSEDTAPYGAGSIVSVNNENNFVIVDIGKDKGVSIGDDLSVYRGAEYIGILEVIQVRNDIAAADIKERVAKIQIGDVVR